MRCSDRRKYVFILFIILAAAALSLSACGSTESAASSPSETPAPAQTPEPTPTPVPTPLIELIGGTEIEHICGRPYTDPGYAAFDADGNDMTGSVTSQGEVICWKVGDYDIEYMLTQADEESNKKSDPVLLASAKRTVHVIPNELADTVEPDEKVIYLTFDDGPCKDTSELLDILAKYDAKATFFIVGNHHEDELEILPRIIREGHALGVHAYWHQYGHIYLNERNFFEDFMAAQNVIHDYTGTYATVARLPGSSRTASTLYGQMQNGADTFTEMMHNMGVRFYDWSLQIEDSNNGSSGTYINFVYGVPKAKLPIIVLQHDVRLYSVRTVEAMLQWGLENGYSFKALDTTVPEYIFFNVE